MTLRTAFYVVILISIIGFIEIATQENSSNCELTDKQQTIVEKCFEKIVGKKLDDESKSVIDIDETTDKKVGICGLAEQQVTDETLTFVDVEKAIESASSMTKDTNVKKAMEDGIRSCADKEGDNDAKLQCMGSAVRNACEA